MNDEPPATAESPVLESASPTPRSDERPRRAREGGGGDEDVWVDTIADETGERLARSRLELELLVFFDPLTDTVHAVGFDGAPARYFRAMDREGAWAPAAPGPTSPSPQGPKQGGPVPLPLTALAATSAPRGSSGRAL